MGVYIQNMEMPTDCHNCPLGFGGGCYCGTSADEYMCPDHGRAEWCPLVPVPKHGRMIDADKLINALQELFDKRAREAEFSGNRGACVTWNDAIYHIKTAPTIIPASEEADHA